jgi:NADPH2:quinone reductase
MQPFRAYRIHRNDGRIEPRFDQLTLEDLTAGDVVVRVRYSDINYKDALAATGAAPIVRKYPLVGGIDLAGEVVSSADPRYAPGQSVLVNGCGLSETQDGGYSEYSRVQGDGVIPVPPGLTELNAMQLGTAGFTAALAVHRMEQNGQAPGKGPILVTGATGGVGAIAINMLAGRGYEVVALTGKSDADDFLRDIGATRILRRQDLVFSGKPIDAVQWAGAIDNLGGDVLTWLTRTVDFSGNIASVGLAAGVNLHTTVIPFLLRGINLLGINSVTTPRDVRLAVWSRIATDLRPAQLERIGANVIAFDDLPTQFAAYIEGRVTGRTVVKIS